MYEITSEQYFYVNIVSKIWLDDVFSRHIIIRILTTNYNFGDKNLFGGNFGKRLRVIFIFPPEIESGCGSSYVIVI